MSVAAGPKIANDGLVFAYDMNNTQKSRRGAPTTNLMPDPLNLATGRSPPASCGSSFTDFTSGGPDNGPFVRVNRVTATGLSADWPWQIGYPTIPIGTTFRFSCYARSINNTVGTIEFSNPDAEEVSNLLTTDWKRYSATFTSGIQSNLQFLRINRSNSNDKTIGSIYDVANAQMEIQLYDTPFVNGTRSSTQSILDLTDNNTITVNGLTYASDNTFSFNGTSGYIETMPIPLTGTSTQSLTWECWVNPTGATGDIINMRRPSTGWNMCPIWASNFRFYAKVWSNANLSALADFTLNQTYHLALVRNYTTNTNSFYVNGVLQSSQVGAYSASGDSNNHYIGRAGSQATNTHFNGSIFNTKIYTTALSASEVQQNFNATRSRYGI